MDVDSFYGVGRRQSIYDIWLINSNVSYHKNAQLLLFYYILLSDHKILYHVSVILLTLHAWLTIYQQVHNRVLHDGVLYSKIYDKVHNEIYNKI